MSLFQSQFIDPWNIAFSISKTKKLFSILFRVEEILECNTKRNTLCSTCLREFGANFIVANRLPIAKCEILIFTEFFDWFWLIEKVVSGANTVLIARWRQLFHFMAFWSLLHKICEWKQSNELPAPQCFRNNLIMIAYQIKRTQFIMPLWVMRLF